MGAMEIERMSVNHTLEPERIRTNSSGVAQTQRNSILNWDAVSLVCVWLLFGFTPCGDVMSNHYILNFSLPAIIFRPMQPGFSQAEPLR
jgi:hypothetical protein